MSEKSTQIPLLPAYLIVGDDQLRRKKVLERLVSRIFSDADSTCDYETFDGSTANGEAIVSSCSTFPFFAEKRLVVVKNADKLVKNDAECLVAYLKEPNETTVFALDAEKLAGTTRLYKSIAALGEKAIISCALPKASELPHHIRNMACSYGITLSDQASAKLADMIGADTIKLDSEFKKLALTYADKKMQPLSEDDILRAVSSSVDVKPWVLTDAFCARDAKKCLTLLPSFSPDSYFLLVKLLSDKIREIMVVASLCADGKRASAGTVLGKNEWQLKSTFAAVSRYSAQDLERALALLCEVEAALKSGGDDVGAMTRWIIAVVR